MYRGEIKCFFNQYFWNKHYIPNIFNEYIFSNLQYKLSKNQTQFCFLKFTITNSSLDVSSGNSWFIDNGNECMQNFDIIVCIDVFQKTTSMLHPFYFFNRFYRWYLIIQLSLFCLFCLIMHQPDFLEITFEALLNRAVSVLIGVIICTQQLFRICVSF